MIFRKGGVLLTVCITLFSFLSVGYMACSKEQPVTSNDPCSKMVCKNGGVCFKGGCTCPAGYEGDSCQIIWITPYLGNWDIREVVVASNIKANEGAERKYTWTIKKHTNPDIFLIDNIKGNSEFKDLSAKLGGPAGRQSTAFAINLKSYPSDSLKTQITGGKGSINSIGTLISGTYFIAYIRDSIPIVDTINFEGTYKQ
jgi:hypothetical protein